MWDDELSYRAVDKVRGSILLRSLDTNHQPTPCICRSYKMIQFIHRHKGTLYKLSKIYDYVNLNRRASHSETFEFMGMEGQYVPHLGFVLWIEKGRHDLLVVWYIFMDLIFVALCDSEFIMVDGPVLYGL